MELNLGSIKIPINAATKTFAILAKRGAGKSYTGAVMAEEFYANNIPFVVFDPIDVWWGLRLDKDGKSKGLPVVVFGLEHADIQLTKEMGRQIAQAIVRDNVSCVISTFGMPKVAQRHLIAEFSEEILNINNTPRHIFIEEAHEFVPQRVFGALGKTFNAVSNLVVMGRNRGLGVTLINQRAATINKDVLTQLDNLLAFRNVSPQDRKALKEWVEYHSAEGDFDKFMASLPSLPTGEGWIWSPEFLSIFERIKIRKRTTFHPDREKIGADFVMPHLDQLDIQTFIEKFSQKKNKAEKLEMLTDKPKTFEPEQKVSIEITKLRNEFESQLIEKDNTIRKLKSDIAHIGQILAQAIELAETGFSFTHSSGDERFSVYAGNKNEALIENLPKYEKDIMLAIKQHPNIPFSKSQLAVKANKSFTSSAFPTAIRRLVKLNLIQEQGKDYIYRG